MSVELLNTLSIVSFILAGVFLVLTIALFFLLKIKPSKISGSLSSWLQGMKTRSDEKKLRREADEKKWQEQKALQEKQLMESQQHARAQAARETEEVMSP